jgi:ABC-type phosphate/phosphonate transport system substrate-binding protein
LREKIAAALLELNGTPEGQDFLKKTRSERVDRVADKAYDGVRLVMRDHKEWE